MTPIRYPISVRLGREDSPKIQLIPARIGLSVFATQDISEGEFLAGFYGQVYFAERSSMLPVAVVNHVVQFSEYFWRASIGIGKYFNHSCAPNCYIQNNFDIIALRPIVAGEELTWDYSTTENSDWVVPGGRCLCFSESCRGDIPPFRNLLENEKQRVQGYLSNWLRRSPSKGVRVRA